MTKHFKTRGTVVRVLPSSRMQRFLYLFFVGFALVMLAASAVSAQDGQPTPVVMEDAVNAIAKKLFCPVCENIPLDACGTAACADWRYEIRLQLEAGKTEQEIIDDFVTRFGDRVVGTPQDPTLRALSLITPWVLVAVGLGLALWTFYNWRKNHRLVETPAASADGSSAPKDELRALLEQDLTG